MFKLSLNTEGEVETNHSLQNKMTPEHLNQNNRGLKSKTNT